MSSSSSRWTMGESSSSSRTSAGRTASPPVPPAHKEPASVSVPLSWMASNEARKDQEIQLAEPVRVEEQVTREPEQPDATSDDASSFPTIKRVPEKSRALKDDGTRRYEPCHVSIGPYHRGSSSQSESHSHFQSQSQSDMLRKTEKQKRLDNLTEIAAKILLKKAIIAAFSKQQEGAHQDDAKEAIISKIKKDVEEAISKEQKTAIDKIKEDMEEANSKEQKAAIDSKIINYVYEAISKEKKAAIFSKIKKEVEEALIEDISRELNMTSAKSYYDYANVSWSGRSDDEKEELAEMLLLDGCYLVTCYGEVRERLSSTTTITDELREKETPCSEQKEQEEKKKKEPASGCGDKGGVHSLMVRDTWYILENQIPFFVLEKILCRVTGCSAEDARMGFTNYAYRLLCNTQRMCIRRDHLGDSSKLEPIFHLLHLLHTLLKQSLEKSKSESITCCQIGWFQNFVTPWIWQAKTWAKKLPKIWQTKCVKLANFASRHGLPNSWYDKILKANQSASRNTTDDKEERQWHRATDYRKYAYVEFKGREIGDSVVTLCSAGPWCCCCWCCCCCCCDRKQRTQGSVLDVRIEGCNVVIPCLRVDGNTWTILLNLMALERQHPRLGTHVTAYCLFMSQIACTREDVELLESKGVIDRHLRTPESVAADFSKLCDAVVLDRGKIETNYLKPIWQQLDKRYNSRRQNVLAWLWLNYFTRRIFLGFITAFILLVAGGLSAVYQVLSYY